MAKLIDMQCMFILQQSSMLWVERQTVDTTLPQSAQQAGALRGAGGHLAAGDGSDCVDVDDVRDDTENGEEDEDKVVLTSSLATALAVVQAPAGDEKYVLTWRRQFSQSFNHGVATDKHVQCWRAYLRVWSKSASWPIKLKLGEMLGRTRRRNSYASSSERDMENMM